MIQKVILVGLLTFIQRGSIMQVLVGLLVAPWARRLPSRLAVIRIVIMNL